MKSILFLLGFIVMLGCSSAGANNQSSKEAEQSAPQTEETPKVVVDAEISDFVNETSVPNEAEVPNINVIVEGLGAGTVTLVGTYTDQRFKQATTSADASGTIQFTHTEPYKSGLYFIVFEDNSYIQVLIDKDQTFTMKTTKANLVKDMQIEGSLENQLLYENLKFQEAQNPFINRVRGLLKNVDQNSEQYKTLREEQTKLNAERKAHVELIFEKYPNSFFTAFKRAGQNPELKTPLGPDGKLDKVAQITQFRKDFWDGVDFNDDRLLSTPVISNKLERYATELTPQHPDSIKAALDHLMARLNPAKKDDPYYSYFVNWIGLKFEPGKSTLMDAEAVYVHVVQKYYTYDRSFWADSAQVYALQLRAHEMAASLIGKKGPDVRANNQFGQPKSIYEIDAPYIVVYLYNPQCEHCAVETPKLVQMEQQWRSKGFAVYAIAIDTDVQEWKAYLTKNGMDGFTNVYDPTNKAIYATYYVNVTPEIYVLNPDRILIGKNLKVNQIETVINRDKAQRGNG
jgi:peroxiredoxin